MGVTISEPELDDDVNDKEDLACNVQCEEILGQAPEEAELEGGKEGRVDCHHQYCVLP